MIYYKLNIGFSHWKHGNFLREEEITKETYNFCYNSTPLYTERHSIWEFNSNEGTGYIQSVATEENLEEIKEFILTKAFNLLNGSIEKKKEEIAKLNSTINRIQEHPIYKAINRDNQIDKILN
jgi:hypothetical protein